MTLKELYRICVPEAKRQTDKLIPWLYYVIRPLSIVATKPLVKTKITPVQVTFVSMLATLAGFALVGFGWSAVARLWGWFCFVVWAILDCVDGNLARCKGLASDRGALWDATGGYMALSLFFFSAGIAAYHDGGHIEMVEKYMYIVMGGLTSLMSLLPRLVMQKKKADSKDNYFFGGGHLGDKRTFGLSKTIALNIESVIGPIQLFLLVAIVFHLLDFFVIAYFLFNITIVLYSLYQLLR